jgi:hypothetical protein
MSIRQFAKINQPVVMLVRNNQNKHNKEIISLILFITIFMLPSCKSQYPTSTKSNNTSAPVLKLDHVLIAVKDLKKAKKEYESFGFTVVYGGHPDKALNALIFLKDGTLIELVGQDKFPPIYSTLHTLKITTLLGSMKDRITSFPKIQEGFFNYSLYSNNLDSAYHYLKKSKLSVSKPIKLTRNREDGVKVEWQLIGTKPYDFPFIISDYTPSRISTPDHKKHLNGAISIDTLLITTINFNSVYAKYNLLYQQSPEISITNSIKKAYYQIGKTVLILQQTDTIRKYYRNSETETKLFVVGSTDKKYSISTSLNDFIRITHTQ